jgi:basic membrane protein A
VLLDEGADVIYVAAGKSGLGAIDQVKNRPHVYAIGVDVDQDALAPGKILTSMVKRVDIAVLRLAKEAAAGKKPHGHTELGLEDGAIGLTDFRYTRNALTSAQFAHLDALRKAVIDGRIAVPSTREELASFKAVPVTPSSRRP